MPSDTEPCPLKHSRENKRTEQVQARKINAQGVCSAHHPPMCPGSSLLAGPALLENTVRSDRVCQLSTLRSLSCGSVLTGVSRAGMGDVASSALAREKEQEEGPRVLPRPLCLPSWRGTCQGERWASLGFLEVLKDVSQACGLQKGSCST